MIRQCLDFARQKLSTVLFGNPYPMKAAQKLYRKVGFDYIDGPMGNTGHTSCNVWLTKSLL